MCFLINLVWVWGDKTKIDKRIIVIKNIFFFYLARPD